MREEQVVQGETGAWPHDQPQATDQEPQVSGYVDRILPLRVRRDSLTAEAPAVDLEAAGPGRGDTDDERHEEQGADDRGDSGQEAEDQRAADDELHRGEGVPHHGDDRLRQELERTHLADVGCRIGELRQPGRYVDDTDDQARGQSDPWVHDAPAYETP